MRTLCLNLQQNLDSSCAEAFLKFSPRVQFRYPHYIFVDIESTAHLIGGEFLLLKQAVDMARKFSSQSTGAIADTPYVAQLLANYRPYEITTPHKDFDAIKSLSVLCLKELEGLACWLRPAQIEQIAHFFQGLGMHTLEDIKHFSLSSFRERWGGTGVQLWERLNYKNSQVISNLEVSAPLTSYGHFDYSVTDIKLLFEQLDQKLDLLFLRATGLNKFVAKVEIILHCEYSNKRHYLQIEPVSPSRDKELFVDLIHARLEKLSLENPIHEFEVTLVDVPERVEQLDFFEPRDSAEEQWRRLISFARQSNCEMGFLELESSHFPESAFKLKSDWPKDFSVKDLIEKEEQAIQVKSSYAKSLADSPRPSLILKQALLLNQYAIKKLRFMSKFPTERIDTKWWHPETEHNSRDYFFAVSEEGQLLWVFQDRQTQAYFLQGYFD